MKKLLGSLCLTLLVATSTGAASEPLLVCEKTGAAVASCCCVQTETARICTLTGEPVSVCCCSAS
jgi:hypothetical protein